MVQKFLIKQAVKIAKKEIDKHDDAKQIVSQVNNVVEKTVEKIEDEAGKRGGVAEFITQKTIGIAKREVNKYT